MAEKRFLICQSTAILSFRGPRMDSLNSHCNGWMDGVLPIGRQYTLRFKKNAPTSADYNYDPVQSILIIISKLFVNDHKSCLVVKFSTSLHICCHYTL